MRDDGSAEDHWGVPRVRVEIEADQGTSAYRDVLDFPLADAASLDEVRDYPKWPSPAWFDYSVVREQCAAVRAAGKVAVFMGDRMNRCAQLKPAMYVRGVEQILLDLVLNDEIAEYLFARITAFYLEYARRTFEAAAGGIDVLFTGDDFGTQNGLFCSPDMWRRFLKPGFQAFVELGHRYGAMVAHHTCGSVRPLIGEMIDSQDGLTEEDIRELQRIAERKAQEPNEK